ncbi:hypothetical protein TD95_003292 [Thielaviopsis punctulata]|uniref:Methyltransferase n=1 Tax=Thielaviopsis punctulata TaxID=72032 RepID=A0A0F4ZBT6_9PEZI|nr:hypothetical protein TD95_003292 [Thielaviopsis punctulata]
MPAAVDTLPAGISASSGFASSINQLPIPPAQTRQVEAVLNFHKDNEDGSPPAPTYSDRPETRVRPSTPHKVVITNVAGEEDKYTLDIHGFQFVSHTSSEKDFVSEAKITEGYYDETAQLLKDVTGASRVYIFDHTLRRTDSSTGGNSGAGASSPHRAPVQIVHIDQSPASARERVSFHLPEEAESLLKGRVQLINVWRPIKPVQRDPLAVALASSVRAEDLVPVALIYPTRRGETLGVRYSADQQWFFKKNMQPNEVLLLKCYDSKTDGRARAVPHSAFEDPTGSQNEARESIELRALVFHPE